MTGITTQSTVTWGTGAGDPGQTVNSTPGMTFVVATLTMTNASTRPEPGVSDLSGEGQPQDATPFTFVITQSDATKAGIKVVTFNAQSWANYVGPMPTGPQCVTGDSGAYNVLPKYGTDCNLAYATAGQNAMVAVATPEGDGLTPPQVAPGASQQLTLFLGPLPEGMPLSAIHVLVIQQGSGAMGWKKIS